MVQEANENSEVIRNIPLIPLRDLVIFPAPGVNFDCCERGAHGGLEADEMTIPLVFAGHGIRKGTIPKARIVDVFPTILDYLEIEKPNPIDGHSLLSEILIRE